MNFKTLRFIVIEIIFLCLLSPLYAFQVSDVKPSENTKTLDISLENKKCIDCHTKMSPALVMEWEYSKHAQMGVGCYECHLAEKEDIDAWNHEGVYVSSLVTPKDCANCHSEEQEEFSKSHHAKAGEILASLDNVLAEKAAGMPGNIADAVNGCWQCHGSIIRFIRDENGAIVRTGKENKPVIDPNTWPNSGMGRLNPDGSKGSCHACHSRHSFQAGLARSPENCGKCHMGPDHPQIEIYNESKHGIAFYANRNRMALDKDIWVLGKDYSAAPTCASCHTGSYMSPDGEMIGNSHDVGERISWTLRPVISTKLNTIIYEDGYKEDYPYTKALPKIGEEITTRETVLENEQLHTKQIPRMVTKIVKWEERRKKMQGACLNCHNDTFVNNFYKQFDDLVNLYNDKFAIPAKQFMDDMTTDGILNPNAPFEKDVQWIYWELWHHEGRRARHGASMMGPDYTHWHGMYEESKHFYMGFLPAVLSAAEEKSPDMKKKYEDRVNKLLNEDSHIWLKGLSAEEAKALKEMYQQRYNEK